MDPDLTPRADRDDLPPLDDMPGSDADSADELPTDHYSATDRRSIALKRATELFEAKLPQDDEGERSLAEVAREVAAAAQVMEHYLRTGEVKPA